MYELLRSRTDRESEGFIITPSLRRGLLSFTCQNVSKWLWFYLDLLVQVFPSGEKSQWPEGWSSCLCPVTRVGMCLVAGGGLVMEPSFDDVPFRPKTWCMHRNCRNFWNLLQDCIFWQNDHELNAFASKSNSQYNYRSYMIKFVKTRCTGSFGVRLSASVLRWCRLENIHSMLGPFVSAFSCLSA